MSTSAPKENAIYPSGVISWTHGQDGDRYSSYLRISGGQRKWYKNVLKQTFKRSGIKVGSCAGEARNWLGWRCTVFEGTHPQREVPCQGRRKTLYVEVVRRVD